MLNRRDRHVRWRAAPMRRRLLPEHWLFIARGRPVGRMNERSPEARAWIREPGLTQKTATSMR